MRPVVFPADWNFRPEPPTLGAFGRRLLAEGDSWFTIGTLNLTQASNILFKLEFSQSVAVVNCAYPGDTLQHVVDRLDDPFFDRLLRHRRFASYWEAILISAGGNDLIDAARVPTKDKAGVPIATDRRLLLTPDEAGPDDGTADASRYVSASGWDRFASYLRTNFAELTHRRDEGPSRGRPIFLHTYATPTVRPSGTVGNPDGWLYPAFVRAGIPLEAYQGVSDLLFARLRQLLCNLDQASGHASALPQVHVFDSAGLADIVRARPHTTGSSNDWVNEIHLTPGGYGKLAEPFGAFIDEVLAGYP